LAVYLDECLDKGHPPTLWQRAVLLGLHGLHLQHLGGSLRPRWPAWLPASAAGRQRVLERYEQAHQRLMKRLQPYLDKQGPLSKKERKAVKGLKVSLTDPEAALGWDKVGTYRPLYNVALVQATDAALTLAWDVVGRNNDQGLLRPMMEKTKEQLGQHLREVLVDGGFLNVGDLVWCEQEGIVVYAPQAEAEDAQANEEKGQSKKPKKYPKAAFPYNGEEKVYYCPQGKRLPEVSRHTEKRQGGVELPVVVHRASGEDCSACAEQKRCTSNPRKGRVVKRYEGEEALERLQQRMKERTNQEVYHQRGQSVELGYADIKEHRGLRVFRGFGKERARVQAGLVILASNALKIMRTLQQRQKDALA